MTTRRQFLQTTAAALISPFLPWPVSAAESKSCFFLNTVTNEFWPVVDPIQWSLENVHNPILERAVDGLLKLTPKDGDRIIRLVVRRCGLNLLELIPDQVVVHHWGQQGLADLKPFFKTHGLAGREIEVVIRDRKKESATLKTGEAFLYGDRISEEFPLDLFMSKCERRFEEQPDDWTGAPWTHSGFAWDGIEDNRIPWAAMKSAWRRGIGSVCPNCDQPTLLVNFGLCPVGLFNRSPRFVSACGDCWRSFLDESVEDVDGWMAANLDMGVRPDFVMMMGKKVLF